MAEANTKTGFNTPAVVLITLAVLLFVYALSLFLQGGFLKCQDMERQAKVMNEENTVANDQAAAQQAILEKGYHWIDRSNGKAGIPIEDAKALVVNKARKES